MNRTVVRSRKSVSWKPLFQLLKKSRLPWWLYIIQLGLIYYMNQLSIYLTDVTGQIAAGNIADSSIIHTYIIGSIITVGIGFLPILTMWVTIYFDNKIQITTWKSFIDLPIKVYEKLIPSSLISRVTTDSIVVGQIIEQFMSWIQALLYLVMSTIVMLGYSKALTMLLLPIIICYTLLTIFGRSWIFTITYRIQENLSILTGYLAERLANIKLIKSSSTEKYEFYKGMEINEERYRIAMSKVKYDTFLSSFQQVMGVILTAVVIIGGSKLIEKGEMNMGNLISFYFFSLQIPSTFQMFVQTMLEMQGTKGATTTVSEIVDLPREEVERQFDMPLEGEDIYLKDVYFSYTEQEKILKGITAHIPYGKTTAIIGPSGGGKTTILKLLERFYEPNHGEILLGNRNVNTIHLDQWRKSFGYVIQNCPLVQGTLRDNLLYGARKDIDDEELMKILDIANVLDFMKELEDGLDTDIGDFGMKLSGGQRQRIAIARAIINRPEYLLMDEATANMDSINEEEITLRIQELMRGKTMIVVAHNLKTVLNADNILLIESGEVIAQGKHKELYKKSPMYRRMVDLQLQSTLN